jgi:hypothetical protein
MLKQIFFLLFALINTLTPIYGMVKSVENQSCHQQKYQKLYTSYCAYTKLCDEQKQIQRYRAPQTPPENEEINFFTQTFITAVNQYQSSGLSQEAAISQWVQEQPVHMDLLLQRALDALQSKITHFEKLRQRNNESCIVCMESYEEEPFAFICSHQHQLCLRCYSNPTIVNCPECRESLAILTICQTCSTQTDKTRFSYCYTCQHPVIICSDCTVTPCCATIPGAYLTENAHRTSQLKLKKHVLKIFFEINKAKEAALERCKHAFDRQLKAMIDNHAEIGISITKKIEADIEALKKLDAELTELQERVGKPENILVQLLPETFIASFSTIKLMAIHDEKIQELKKLRASVEKDNEAPRSKLRGI